MRAPQNAVCLRNCFFSVVVGLLVEMDVVEGFLLSHMLGSYFLFQQMEVLGGEVFPLYLC